MKYFLSIIFIAVSITTFSQTTTVEDDFEGNGTISTWTGDNCGMDNNFANPSPTGINTSATVLKYTDTGGQYANVRFDADANFDLSTNNVFTLKIYVSSSSITGTSPNQISLKLQDGTLNEPWTTQSEIIKTVILDQWQTISFDFENDSYINFNSSSGNPTSRTDFNRVVLQVNGENNNNNVTAYIDDFLYNGTINVNNPVFDNLVWSDEFDGNGAINTTKWFHQTQLPNGSSWYNGELQHYTNRTDNSSVENGILSITAKKETFTDQGHTKQYTSARLNSKFAFTYGKVEVRAKLPTGVGTWPAIWTLGKNINEPGGYWTDSFGAVNWPACGEIDIMEHWGNNQNYIQSALHTPSSSGGTVNKGGQTIPTASTEFHIYTLEWTSEKMVFKVDGVTHYTYNPAVKNSDTWPFDSDQYLLLNVAIEAGVASSFTQSKMEIDYVRVYQESTASTETTIVNEPEITLYPNPTKNNISIKLPRNIFEAKISFFNLLGQEIKTVFQNKNTQEHIISDFSTGTYLVKIDTKNSSSKHKILKIY